MLTKAFGSSHQVRKGTLHSKRYTYAPLLDLSCGFDLSQNFEMQ